MRGMSNLGRVMLASAIALGEAGCGRGVTSTPGDAPNLEEWVANVRARPAPPLEPLPVMQQFETFEYAAQGLRDPFSDAFPDTGGVGPRPDSDRRRHELEEFPLDSLEMVGTIGRGGGIIGLVMAPNKVTHRVRTGTTRARPMAASSRSSKTASNWWNWYPTAPAAGWSGRPQSRSNKCRLGYKTC